MRQPNKSMIGLFMLTGLAALIGVTIFLLRGSLFNTNQERFVMYFDESVKGLSIGAPLVFEGVKIGEVTKIVLVANDDLTFSIPVFVKIDPRQKTLFGGNEQFKRREALMQTMIDKGLRARLGMQSFLTGQLMIELTMLPGSEINLKYTENGVDEDDDVIEIPTVLSAAGSINKSLQDYPIGKTFESFNNILNNLSRDLPLLFADINELINSIDHVVSSRDSDFHILMGNVNQAALEISGAARSVHNLTDYLERHPESLLLGKGEPK